MKIVVSLRIQLPRLDHVVGWDKAKMLDLESHRTTRWLKESIWIRSWAADSMNKDEAAYKVNRIFDQLIKNINHPVPPGITS